MSNMKRWLRARGMTQRSLAIELGQTASNITQKVNNRVQWQYRDCLVLRDKYGLSSDFVQDLVPYESLSRSDEGLVCDV